MLERKKALNKGEARYESHEFAHRFFSYLQHRSTLTSLHAHYGAYHLLC